MTDQVIADHILTEDHAAFRADCAHIVGNTHILTSDSDLEGYGTDWTGQFRALPIAVARPNSTEQIAELIRLCAARNIPVIPQGGRTGLCGGGVPLKGQPSLILSLERMNKIRALDVTGRTVTVEAGVVLETLQDHIAKEGLIFPLMFGAKGSCMIGGNLSTNAGGSNVVKYGNTRELCLGLEAVMPDGTIVNDLVALRKNNTGYDTKDLLIGAEGTLGIITAAVFKLAAEPKVRSTSFLSVSSLEAAVGILNRVQDQTGGSVEAFEYVPQPVIDAICHAFPDITPPLEGPVETGILLEVSSSRPADGAMTDDGEIHLQAAVMELLAELMEEGLILDAVIAQNEQQRLDLWKMRESVLESIAEAGPAYHFDISLPLAAISDFVATTDAKAADLGFAPLTIGHLGDGNLHYAVGAQSGRDWGALPIAEMRDTVFAGLKRLDGSFSAEHGIGQSKLDAMRALKDPGQLQVMRTIKAALDPLNIMNPGKLIPME